MKMDFSRSFLRFPDFDLDGSELGGVLSWEEPFEPQVQSYAPRLKTHAKSLKRHPKVFSSPH